MKVLDTSFTQAREKFLSHEKLFRILAVFYFFEVQRPRGMESFRSLEIKIVPHVIINWEPIFFFYKEEGSFFYTRNTNGKRLHFHEITHEFIFSFAFTYHLTVKINYVTYSKG